MNFIIESWINERRDLKFKNTTDQFYYQYDVLKPDSFCCNEMRDSFSAVRENHEGVNTETNRVIGLTLDTNPEWGSRIILNLCPNCGEKVTFTVNLPITLEERMKNIEKRKEPQMMSEHDLIRKDLLLD